MYYIFLLTLIIIGLVAAADYVEKKIPQSKTILDFLKPHDGWIGLVTLVLGLFWLIKLVFNLGTMLKWVPVQTFIWIASYLLLIILGLILCQKLILTLTGNNPKVMNFTNKIVAKFSPLKQTLGLAAIGTGLLNLLLYIT